MAPAYPSAPLSLKAASLPDEALLAIGRIVRGAAELEDIIGFFIGALAEIDESRQTILLGRASVIRKFQVAEYLAESIGGEAKELFDDNLRGRVPGFLAMRNAVAHGALLGQAEDGSFVFLTSKTEAPEGSGATKLTAMAYRLEDIKKGAEWIEEVVPQIEANLRLKASRDIRLQRPVQPRPRGRK